MRSLLANPIDDFFFALIEPPEDREAEVTTELWRIAPQFRTLAPDDHEIYDYVQERGRDAMPTTDYAQGLSDGCAGDKSKLFQNKNNKSYLRGHTAGTEMRKAEHHCTEHMYIAEATNGGSGQRVIRGKAEY